MATMTYLEHMKYMLGRQANILNQEIKKAKTVDELLAAGERAKVIDLTFVQISKSEK